MSPRDPPSALSGVMLDVYRKLLELRTADVKSVATRLDESGRSLAYTTVQTMLNRLVDKGHARSTRSGKKLLYTALTPLAQLRRTRLRELVDDLYDGASTELGLQLLRSRKLSSDDLAALEAIVAKARKGRRSE